MIPFNKYKIIGVTGIIGSGKSFFVNSLKNDSNLKINIIEIDDIRRNLLWKSLSSLAISLRKKIIIEFFLQNIEENFFFNRESFTSYIFSNTKLLNKFNEICIPYFKEEIKNLLIPNQLNFIVWVNLIEENYFELVEYIVLLHNSEKTWQNNNLINLTEISSRKKLQSSFEEKLALIKEVSQSHSIPYGVIENE